MRKIFKNLQISRRSTVRVVKDDLGLAPHNMQRHHSVSEVSKTERFNRVVEMLEEMRSAGDNVFLRSDDKIFTVEPQVNSQNDRMLTERSPVLIRQHERCAAGRSPQGS